MRFLLARVALASALIGCAAQGKAARRPERPTPPPQRRADPPTMVVGQTLIYPVRWGRAEDLAVTLEPYLVSRYGPGVRVVPQVQSNSLLIYVPSHREQELERARKTAPGSTTTR